MQVGWAISFLEVEVTAWHVPGTGGLGGRSRKEANFPPTSTPACATTAPPSPPPAVSPNFRRPQPRPADCAGIRAYAAGREGPRCTGPRARGRCWPAGRRWAARPWRGAPGGRAPARSGRTQVTTGAQAGARRSAHLIRAGAARQGRGGAGRGRGGASHPAGLSPRPDKPRGHSNCEGGAPPVEPLGPPRPFGTPPAQRPSWLTPHRAPPCGEQNLTDSPCGCGRVSFLTPALAAGPQWVAGGGGPLLGAFSNCHLKSP